MRRLFVAALAIALLACGGASEAGRLIKGTRSAAPGPASLTVSWKVPTTMADGGAATLADQQVCYDTVSRMGTEADYATCVSVGSASSTSYVVTGLQAATTYYIAVKSSVSGAIRSEPSPEVSATTAP